nr:proline-rich protein 13 isoform X2 [Danio rerio]|eukprot:XP_021335347.1 proline-rich protein 13 isoform X2 [Danio rerio]
MWPNQGPPNPAYPCPPNPSYPAMPIPSGPGHNPSYPAMPIPSGPGVNPMYPPGMNQPMPLPHMGPHHQPAVPGPYGPYPGAGVPCTVPQYGGHPAGHKKHKKMKKMKKAHKEHKHMKHGKSKSSSSSSCVYN